MALTILNNIAAIAAENQLNITSGSLNSTLEQLSSDRASTAALTIRLAWLSPTACRRILQP